MLRQALSICGVSCAAVFSSFLLEAGPLSSVASAQEISISERAFGSTAHSAHVGEWSIEQPAQPHMPTYRPAPDSADNTAAITRDPDAEELHLPLPVKSRVDGGLAQATPSKTTEPTVAPADNPVMVEPQLTPELVDLRSRVRRALAIYETKHLNAQANSPWEIMHGFIGYGLKTQIYRDGPGSEKVNAISYLSWEGRGRGQALVYRSGDSIRAAQGPGVQGHPGQFAAMLAQCKVSLKSPMRAGGKDFTVADLIESEKRGCQPHTELTFRLIALSHYLRSDATWTSDEGQQWSIPRLIKEEIRQPIQGAACGGTHRLFGITYAYKMREKQGEPVTGEFARAKKYISDYQRYTFNSLQNPDGSFSTEWFARPGNRQDPERKLQTTGHILEWLVFSLNDDQLRDPRTMKAVKFLADLLISQPDRAWAIGPHGHAIHALVMYDQRVFRPRPASQQPAIAATEPRVTMAPPAGVPLPAKMHEAMAVPQSPATARTKPSAQPRVLPTVKQPTLTPATAEPTEATPAPAVIHQGGPSF